MKRLFDCANHYMQARDWKMAASLKFCLCSIGILLGLVVPEKHKKTAAAAAGGVFLATYIPLMADFLSFALDFSVPRKKNHIKKSYLTYTRAGNQPSLLYYQ